MGRKVQIVLNLTITVETEIPDDRDELGIVDKAAIMDIWDESNGADILTELDMMDKVEISPVRVKSIQII